MDLNDGILAVDVGSGTQDILIWKPDAAMENCPKMVLPSATTSTAYLIDKATDQGHAVFLSGTVMGGGPCGGAVRRHLSAGLSVFALEAPALTFHDDIEKVKHMGVRIVKERPDISPLTEIQMGDIQVEHIRKALSLFHVHMPGHVAVSVQDHGFSPKESNRAFRFKQWETLLMSGERLESLLYQKPPAHLSRMKAVTETVPGAWVMDTGASAILGAMLDPWVAERVEKGITVVNIGNEHVVAALMRDGKVWGIYEHHTSLVDPSKLAGHLERFRREALTQEEIFDEMGHGCKILPGAAQAGSFQPLSITGPNRERFAALGGHMAAPFGDMMLTGCFGLVEAVRKGLSSS